MRRRDFVKAAVAASITAKSLLAQQVAPSAPPPVPVAPGPVPWMRGLTEARPLAMTPLVPDAVADPSAHYFTEQQYATLRKLGDLLMPSHKTYPGASEAGTPEFLDFLIGISPPDRQQMYQSGLDRLEAESRKKFNIAFAATDAAQSDQLLRPWLRTWMTDFPPTEPYEHFINQAHSDIRTATINSQAWNDATVAEGHDAQEGLYWFPIDPDLHHEPATRRPVPKRRT